VEEVNIEDDDTSQPPSKHYADAFHPLLSAYMFAKEFQKILANDKVPPALENG